jgi:hypothetical protein
MSRRGCSNHATTHRCNAGVGKPTTTRHWRNESATATTTMPFLTAAVGIMRRLTTQRRRRKANDDEYGPPVQPDDDKSRRNKRSARHYPVEGLETRRRTRVHDHTRAITHTHTLLDHTPRLSTIFHLSTTHRPTRTDYAYRPHCHEDGST